MPDLPLRFGVTDCDRMRPLVSGVLPIPGVAPEWTVLPVQELFNRMLATHEFDVCEYPLATYLRERAGLKRYVAVPFFTSRHFRLSCIFVHEGAGLRSPADLAGKRVGVPIWDMAAAVWLRGILEEHYGLPRVAPVYVTGGLEFARQGDEHPQVYPEKYTIVQESGASLAELLARGEIDALYTARAPSSFVPSGPVRRLFEDPRAVEREFYARTGLFPQMHVLCLKAELTEAHPGLPRALYDACVAAQARARAALYDSAALDTMLPWQLEHLLETEAELGPGYWASGLAGNRAALETLIGYMVADDLLDAAPAVEALFPASLAET